MKELIEVFRMEEVSTTIGVKEIRGYAFKLYSLLNQRSSLEEFGKKVQDVANEMIQSSKWANQESASKVMPDEDWFKKLNDIQEALDDGWFCDNPLGSDVREEIQWLIDELVKHQTKTKAGFMIAGENEL